MKGASASLLPLLLVASRHGASAALFPPAMAGCSTAFVAQRQISGGIPPLGGGFVGREKLPALKKPTVGTGASIGAQLLPRIHGGLCQLRSSASPQGDSVSPPQAIQANLDPEKHIWLEEVEGKEALSWVEQQNAAAIAQ